MIGSTHQRRVRTELSYAIPFVILMMISPILSARAQHGWRNSLVVSRQLWLGQPVRLDASAMPAVTIAPGGLTYVAFSLEGGRYRYYSKDFPGYWGTFNGFSPIFRLRAGNVVQSGPAHLLAVDSASTLHYVTSTTESDACLEHATNRLNDTILTGFGYLNRIGNVSCGPALGGASTAVDAQGVLHMVCTIGESVMYFRRTGAGWSSGVRLSESGSVATAPSLAVSPSGTVHVTFVSANAPQGDVTTLNYTTGSDDTFDEPYALALRDGDGAYGVAAIVHNGDEKCHVVYVDQSTGSVPSVKYVTGSGAGWSAPETAVADMRYSFGDVSVACDRYGAVHIVAGYAMRHRDSVRDAELMYVENAGGNWSKPVSLTANEVDDVPANQGNGFVALRDSLLAAVYTTDDGAGNYSVALSRRMIDFNPVLELASDTVRFEARKGSLDGEPNRYDTAISIANRGARLYRSLEVTGIRLLDAVPSSISLEPAALPDPVRGGDSYALPVALFVRDYGAFSARVEISSNGGMDTVVFAGAILDPNPTIHALRLDTSRTDVGAIARLTCRMTPPLDSLEGVDRLTLRMQFNPDALFPRRVLVANPTRLVPAANSGRGSLDIVISGERGASLHGDTLFTIEFEGLLTGEPENDVQLHVVPAHPLFEPSARPGLVRLDGCEVARDLAFGKGGFADRIAPNPVHDVLSFRYLAPPDVPVSVQLVDLLGATRPENELPAGTGEVQDARIDLRSLSPGLYFVRLRVGDLIVTDTMIKE